MIISGCSGEKALNPGDVLRGEWHSEFTASYYPTVVIQEGGRDWYRLTHESIITFSNGRLEVFVDPPVPDLFGLGEEQSYLSCRYSVSKDTLTLLDYVSGEEIESYTFSIADDTLKLAYIPLIVEQGDDFIVAMPIYGGIPWGRAHMWHAGDFFRIEKE